MRDLAYSRIVGEFERTMSNNATDRFPWMYSIVAKLRLNLLRGKSMPSLIRGLCIIAFTSALSSCAGYTPGAKAYWDARVKELCAKDGGEIVHERVQLNQDQYKQLRGFAGSVPVPTEEKASSSSPYVSQWIETRLNESPSVTRLETRIIRRSDRKVLGRSVQYARSGGDFPTGIAHDSSYSCPEHVDVTRQIFIVEGGAK